MPSASSVRPAPSIPPSPALIRQLEARACSALDWRQVRIHPQCDPLCFQGVSFEGPVRVGRMDSKHLLRFHGLEPRPPGLFRVRLSHAVIGDGVRLEDIGECARHVHIGDGSMVLRCAELAGTLDSSFAIGTPVSAVNENGGRPCHLHDALGLQWAWLETFCKHDPALQRRLVAAVRARARELRGQASRLGKGVLLRDCGIVRNVMLGDLCRLEGASRVEEVFAHERARIDGPARLKQVVLGPGSLVEGACHASHVHLGEGSELGKGALAEHALLFADSQFHAGELSAAWAGPHAISHHRATLLIAGAWSFYNAGSASNFSNHHYRLGPVHQGLLERGCKTGSSSALLFPSRAGAFSTLIGRHTRMFDSSDFPFSLVVANPEGTTLLPGALAFSSGQYRDEQKWPVRDRRGQNPADIFHTKRLSPYTAQSALRGLTQLRDLAAKVPGEPTATHLLKKGLRITASQINKGCAHYSLLLRFYVYQVVLGRFAAAKNPVPWPLFSAGFRPMPPWVDWGGLLCPKAELDLVMEGVRHGRLASPLAVREEAERIHGAYPRHEWNWILQAAPAILDPMRFSDADAFRRDMEKTLVEAYDLISEDAKRDYQPSTALGYGLGGDERSDFNAVRGSPLSDATLGALQTEKKHMLRMARALRFETKRGRAPGRRPTPVKGTAPRDGSRRR